MPRTSASSSVQLPWFVETEKATEGQRRSMDDVREKICPTAKRPPNETKSVSSDVVTHHYSFIEEQPYHQVAFEKNIIICRLCLASFRLHAKNGELFLSSVENLCCNSFS